MVLSTQSAKLWTNTENISSQKSNIHVNAHIVWLSLVRVTDWLNTLTWLQHNLVCSPPQSCGGGILIDTTKCFHANKWQNELAILWLIKKMYVDRPWPRADCLLCAQYNRYALHCAQLKENPRIKKLLSYMYVNFYKLCRSHIWGAI